MHGVWLCARRCNHVINPAVYLTRAARAPVHAARAERGGEAQRGEGGGSGAEQPWRAFKTRAVSSGHVHGQLGACALHARAVHAVLPHARRSMVGTGRQRRSHAHGALALATL